MTQGALAARIDARLSRLLAPPAERLAEAARTLAGVFPPEDAAVYLSTLVWQDPETWGGLADLPEVRPTTETDTSQA